MADYEAIFLLRSRKNEDEEIRISSRDWKGKSYMDIRLWFKAEQNSQFLPTKRGLTLTKDQFEEMIAYFSEATARR